MSRCTRVTPDTANFLPFAGQDLGRLRKRNRPRGLRQIRPAFALSPANFLPVSEQTQVPIYQCFTWICCGIARAIVSRMRITIVDRQMNVVREVLDSIDLQRDLPHFADFLAEYRHADYRWFVTPSGTMPQHAQHDAHGMMNGR